MNGLFARFIAPLALVFIGAGISTSHAHVDWTRVNAADPDLLGLYHFDSDSHDPGEIFESDTCWPTGRGLYIGIPSAGGAAISLDTVEAAFNPHSIKFVSAQNNETTETLEGLAGDLTIEFWFKWDNGLTSSSFEVGLRSGAKLRITRNTSNSAADQFGILATHGDFLSAPGFTNWPAVADEGETGEWHHAAMAIHSTGQHFVETLGHDVYSTGTLARFYLNGHPTGSFPHTLDISGMRVHDASKLRINNLAGTVSLDEVAIWGKDWSANGTASNPFADGRGSGNCRLEWTRTNDSDALSIGLFHNDDHDHDPGEIMANGPCLPIEYSLVIGAPVGTGMTTVHDTPEAIFDPHSMHLVSAQDSNSTATVPNLAGDLTIEFWFKWDNALTSSSFEFGLRSGAKLRITRDVLNPANDQFGISATHGDFRMAPGFVNWPSIAPVAAPLGEWLHAGLTIHSTGIYEDLGLGHEVYAAGSQARFYLNGYPLGNEPHTLDLFQLKVHDASRLRMTNLAGDIYVDEATIWTRDWSADGLLSDPFADGRGSGLCNAVSGSWTLYD